MSLPVDLVLGIYLGLIAGIVPALITGLLGFIFRYFAGVTVPGLGVVVLAIAVAGVNGGFLALNDPVVRSSPVLVTALLVVLMFSLFAHAQGDKLGASMPRRFSLRSLQKRTISADVVQLVGSHGQVRVRVSGDVSDVEGCPPLPDTTRSAIASDSWTFPGDLSIDDLENRLAERLRNEYDLAEVSVSIDDRARATVAAAPDAGTLSKRVPAGKHAVSIDTLVPSGIARGDDVRVHLSNEEDSPANPASPNDPPSTEPIEGTVVSARSGDGVPSVTVPEPAAKTGGGTSDGTAGETEPPVPAPRSPTTTGGDGRVTLAVDRDDADRLLAATDPFVEIRARGVRRELELVTLFRRAGLAVQRLTVGDGPISGTTLGEAHVRNAYGVTVLALRSGDDWTVAPTGGATLANGSECFVVRDRSSLDAFGEAIA